MFVANSDGTNCTMLPLSPEVDSLYHYYNTRRSRTNTQLQDDMTDEPSIQPENQISQGNLRDFRVWTKTAATTVRHFTE